MKNLTFSNKLFSRVFFVTLIIYILTVSIFNKYLFAPAFFQFQWFLMIIVFTSWTRTLSTKHFIGFIIIGATVIPILTLPFFRTNSRDWINFAVPIIEELFKILPLLILFAFKKSRLRISSGITDFFLIGAAVGGGFDLVEESLLKWDWSKFTHMLYGPKLGLLHLFPNSSIQNGPAGRDLIVFLGHGTSTAFIALAIGIGYKLYRQKKKIPGILIPITTFIFITLSHMLYNMTSTGSLKGFYSILHIIIGYRGVLLAWLLWIILALIIYYDKKTLSIFFKKYEIEKIKFRKLRIWKQSFGKKIIRFLIVYFALLRRVRILAYTEDSGYQHKKTKISVEIWKAILEYPDNNKTE